MCCRSFCRYRNWSEVKRAAAKAIVDAGSSEPGLSVWQCPEAIKRLQEVTGLTLKEVPAYQAVCFGLHAGEAERPAADFTLRETSGKNNICLFDTLQLAGVSPLSGMSVAELIKHRRDYAVALQTELRVEPRRSRRRAGPSPDQLSPAQQELLEGANDMAGGGMTSAAVIEHMACHGILRDAGKALRVYKVVGADADEPVETLTVVDPGTGELAKVELVYQAGAPAPTSAIVAPAPAPAQGDGCSATKCLLKELPANACDECKLPGLVHHACIYADVQALGAGGKFPGFRHVCLGCLRASMGLSRQLLPAVANSSQPDDAVIHALWGGYADPLAAGPVVHFSYLERGDHSDVQPAAATTRHTSSDAAEIFAAATTTNNHAINPNAGLRSFTLHPRDKNGAPLYTGLDLFAHMIKMRNRNWAAPARKYNWSVDSVGVDISAEQRSIVQPTQDELMEGSILKEIGTTKASRRMARRRLNTLGEVNAHSVWANAPDRLERMQNTLDLAVTLGDMQQARAASKATAAAEKEQVLRSHHPGALQKLGEVGLKSAASLTVKQMVAILLLDFDVSIPTNAKKAVVVERLQTEAARAKWTPPRQMQPQPQQQQRVARRNTPPPAPKGPRPSPCTPTTPGGGHTTSSGEDETGGP